MRVSTKGPLAALAALVLAVASLACVTSCWTAAASVPPCHRHHTQSCAPLLLTAEAPQAAVLTAPVVLPALLPSPTPPSQAALSWVADQELSASPPSLAPPSLLVLRI